MEFKDLSMLAPELFIEEKLSMVYGRIRLKIKGNVLTQFMVYTLISNSLLIRTYTHTFSSVLIFTCIMNIFALF